jgi:hypothetical protein
LQSAGNRTREAATIPEGSAFGITLNRLAKEVNSLVVIFDRLVLIALCRIGSALA